MSALTCDICGGNLAMNESGEFAVCESCGMKHTKERVKVKVQEVRGTIQIEGDVKIKQSDFDIRAGVLEKYHGEAVNVIIPDTVTHIGNYSFQGCLGLSSIVMPNGVVSIEYAAFRGCKFLSKITFSDNLRKISEGAFEDCENLEELVLPEGLECIDMHAFRNCKKIKRIKFPSTLSSIGLSAFRECISLEDVELPEGLKTLDGGTFEDCTNLKSIFIPYSLTTPISSTIFSRCPNVTHIKGNSQIIRESHRNTLYGLQGTPFFKDYYKKLNRCQYCGEYFEGLFSKKCSKCGKPKDY